MANIFNVSNLKKTYYYLKRNGILQTVGAAMERLQAPYFADYTYSLPCSPELEKQRREVWNSPIVFSVLVPAYETKEEFLKVLIDSMVSQTYPYWELIIADASESANVKSVCESYHEERIRYVPLENNAGISENTNQGLKKATGEYVGLLDHDDYLTPDALYEMAKAIEDGRKKGKDYAFLYSDEDKCDENGELFYDPHFKMDFNLDLFLTNNYICHFCVMKRELMAELKFRKKFDGAQDYDLCLRAVDKVWEENPKVEEFIFHVPKVLYHWRCHNDSTAANPQSKKYAYEAGRRALQNFVEARGWSATVEEMPHVGFYKVIYEDGIFAQRKDVALLGGKKIKWGKIAPCVFDSKGKPLYQGIPLCYSGYIHRAVLTQNASQLDIESWKVNPGIQGMIEEFLQKQAGKEFRTHLEKQKAICDYLTSQGYRLYWDPSWKV